MRNREKRILRNLWSTLSCTLDPLEWGNLADGLLKLTTEESKNHNRVRPDHCRNDMGISLESKYFAVLRVTEYLTGSRAPKVEDYISTQKSCFYAYALVSRHKDTLMMWLKENPCAWQLLLWDYAIMVDPTNQPPYNPKMERVEIERQSTGDGFYLKTITYSHPRYYGPTSDLEALKKAVTCCGRWINLRAWG